MAEQPKQDRVWDFGMEAYLLPHENEQATGNTVMPGAIGVGKTASLNALLNAEPDRADADTDADRAPAR